MPMANDYHELDALDAADAIRGGRITASGYISALAARIEAREPDIHAWQHFNPQQALEQAKALAGRPDLAELPLAGAAAGIKDIIDTADMPTENGTVLDQGRQPPVDAAVVRLLRAAGVIIMGKTVTTELAFMHPSKTRNPHDAGHTPGGSSSGSAAAVAAGMVPIALGTQTNGSVVRPASFCGIYGLKPTFGLFPREGVLEESASLDTVGVFARSLPDIAALTQVLAKGPAAQAAPANYADAARDNASAPRFAFVRTPAWPFAEEAAKAAIETFVEGLGTSAERAGLPPEFDRAIAMHRTVMLTEIALNFGRYYERGKDRLSAPMREAIETGRGILAADYAGALRERERLYERLEALLQRYDAIVTLPAAGPAPRGHETTGNPAFCTIWTYLGVPALTLPLLSVDGLPLGIQLVGPRLGEAKLFQAAAALLSRVPSLAKR
jgi:Asp-tRNA(Asn)/Glu-tRNA(Gln) amidotransferase A subunit family amidase